MFDDFRRHGRQTGNFPIALENRGVIPALQQSAHGMPFLFLSDGKQFRNDAAVDIVFRGFVQIVFQFLIGIVTLTVDAFGRTGFAFRVFDLNADSAILGGSGELR